MLRELGPAAGLRRGDDGLRRLGQKGTDLRFCEADGLARSLTLFMLSVRHLG